MNRSPKQIARADSRLQSKPETGFDFKRPALGNGQGGPNGEYLLALALALEGAANIHALAIDTDGIDGSQDNAGARIAPDTLSRGQMAGCDAVLHLATNDSYGFFSAVGDLIVTGPTRTNLNDLRLILVL